MANRLETWGLAGLGSGLRGNCDWICGVVGGGPGDKDAGLASQVSGQVQWKRAKLVPNPTLFGAYSSIESEDSDRLANVSVCGSIFIYEAPAARLNLDHSGIL